MPAPTRMNAVAYTAKCVLELDAHPRPTLMGAAFGQGRFVVGADLFRAVVLEERGE